MKGLGYQLKSVFHDKFCLMTFLLPIMVAAALSFAGKVDFSSLGEHHFGVVENDLPEQAVEWLEGYGMVTVYPARKELVDAVNEPSTNLIGVESEGKGIKTMVSGDELDLFRQTADTLPILYEQRNITPQVKIQILEYPDVLEGLKDMFIAVILIVAMFMGCTFNAMNMISEKEDGVALVNEILPMTRSQYIMQKLSVGFMCGGASSIITSCIVFRFSLLNAALMLVLIVVSSFTAALIGLFIGRAAGGLMTGVVYIKMVMLLFIAVPIISFLLGLSNPFIMTVCYLVPSQATFGGIMGLSSGSMAVAIKNSLILVVHCIAWFLLYLSISKRKKCVGS
ncbi:MAG: ABC transporter permease [Lachnospiraceae bacterium]|nr:ABC transporter permease [Lachnospiraceae bacterium]